MDGQLIELTADTTRNGDNVSLTGKRDADKFVLQHYEEERVLPIDIATTDSFWLMSSVKHNKMLDVRSGELFDVNKTQLDSKILTHEGREYEVDGYHVSTEKMDADLWYHGDFLLSSDVTEQGQTAHLTSVMPL